MKSKKKIWHAPKVTNLLVLEETLSRAPFNASGEESADPRDCDVPGDDCLTA